MNYYTSSILVPLAWKLREKGMPMRGWQGWATPYISVMENSEYDWLDEVLGILEPQMVERRYSIPTFGACFDWLMEKGLSCEITRHIDFAYEEVCPEWDWCIEKVGVLSDAPQGYSNTWHEAANAAITKALELIK